MVDAGLGRRFSDMTCFVGYETCSDCFASQAGVVHLFNKRTTCRKIVSSAGTRPKQTRVVVEQLHESSQGTN